MHEVATRLLEVVNAARPRLFAMPEAHAAEKPYPDKWSIKEILGHLVDSASTNHQRIVRMQEVRDLGAFVYEQSHWVSSQQYQREPWGELVLFWHAYNMHVAHIIRHIDPAALGNTCDIDYGAPVTLRIVAEDYIAHLEHHLGQIFSGDDPRKRAKWMAEG